MALELTQNQFLATQEFTKRPNIVFQIDGLDTLFGAVSIKKIVQIGDPGLEIGDPEVNPNGFYIGGFKAILNQKTLIDFNGTSRTIRQTLNQDLGQGSSISAFKIALVDDGTLIDLITPGALLDDVLGRKARIWYSVNKDTTSFPEDYNVVFRGIITELEYDAGSVVFSINHPDNKKKAEIFKLAEDELFASITNSATSLTLVNAVNFLAPMQGPDLTISGAFQGYVLIDDEIIRYTGKTGNTLTGLSRGQFGTTAAAHDANAQVSSRYRLSGNVMDLALQMMLSGWGDYYVESIPVKNFNIITPLDIVGNSILFDGADFEVLYGLRVGDYVTTSGAGNGANNFTLRQIIDIVTVTGGTYLVVDGAALVDEADTPAIASFRSQYDVLPDGWRMAPDEVDVDEHLRLKQLFLSSMEYDFFLKDTVDGREWLEKQIYSPVACYSLPRKARASVGYHIGPIPGQNIKTFNEANVLNPDAISVKRSTNRNFFNEVVYSYDPDYIEDKFTRGRITISETSKAQIPGGAKTLNIDSMGLRESLGGANIATSQSNRRLDRYQFGAESFTIDVTYGSGYSVEIGDILIFDGTNLQVADIKNNQRGMAARLFEVQNKSLDLKGVISLDIVDTSFDGSARRGLISPSSIIQNGISTTQFVIQASFGSRFASDEYRKWNGLIRPAVRIRNADFSIDEMTVIVGVSFNTITVNALSFTPTAGLIMEFAPYDDINTTDQQKLIYAYMNNTVFADGGAQYLQL